MMISPFWRSHRFKGREMTYFLVKKRQLYRWLFHGLCISKIFQTLHDYNPVFRFLSHCSFKRCMVATHMKKIKHSMLFVTGIYLGDVTHFLQFCTVMLIIWAFALLVFNPLFGTTGVGPLCWELPKVPSFPHEVGQNIALHASATTRISIHVISTYFVHWTLFCPILLPIGWLVAGTLN